MSFDFDILPGLIGTAVLFLIGYILLYYKFVYSIIDPIFIFVFTTAFASVLALQTIPDLKDILHFFGCQLAAWLGFAFANKFSNTKNSLNVKSADYYFFDPLLLRRVSFALLSLYILSNLFVAYTKGFTLLSDSPTASKVANFQEGFGVFRKINWGVGTFISTAFIFMYLYKGRKIDLIVLLVIACFTALEGSKSSLMRIVLSAGFVFYHPAFRHKRDVFNKLKRYIPLIVLSVLGVFFTVLVKENDGLDNAFLAFFVRLLYSGDSLLYYYIPVNTDYFASYTPLDYFSRLSNPILGFFRLQDYQEALGNIMVENIRLPTAPPAVIVGPNTPFYIEGRIYFGFWGAFFYSALVGYVCASFRVYYFSIIRTSAFHFVFVSSLCLISSSILTDVNLAVTQMFDLSFFTLPVVFVISMIYTQKITLHHTYLFKKPTC